MSNRVRRLMLACIVALHGAVTLLGPGHHALDGAIERFLSGGTAPHQADESTPYLAVDKDCPACHHLSHNSTPPGRAEPPAGEVEEPADAPIAPIGRPATCKLASIPRAPPSPAC